MNDKYIIRNCPALYHIEGMTDECLGTGYQCQDCTDCLLKQIYFKCEEAYAYGGKGLCSKIIKMLDIEECE